MVGTYLDSRYQYRARIFRLQGGENFGPILLFQSYLRRRKINEANILLHRAPIKTHTHTPTPAYLSHCIQNLFTILTNITRFVDGRKNKFRICFRKRGTKIMSIIKKYRYGKIENGFVIKIRDLVGLSSERKQVQIKQNLCILTCLVLKAINFDTLRTVLSHFSLIPIYIGTLVEYFLSHT